MFVESPDGRIVFALAESEERLVYAILLNGRPVIEDSPLGIELENVRLPKPRLLDSGDVEAIEETYQLVGSVHPIEVDARQRRVVISSDGGVDLALIVRVTNDTVGFRYSLEHDRPDRLMSEATAFRFSREGLAWIQPHDLPGGGEPAYEALYTDAVAIGHSAPVPSWNLPALFHTGGLWVLLAESDTGVDNFGAHLQPDGNGYRIELPQPDEGRSLEPPGEPVGASWTSPWRLVVVSNDLAGIVSSTAVTDFASPSNIADTSWIRPGRVSWSWWSDHASPLNVTVLLDFVDLSAEFGWEHTLVDANWNKLDEGDLDVVLSHAADVGVGLFLWYNSGGSNNVVPEGPRDRMVEAAVRSREMQWLADRGVAGIKVDFFQSDRTDMINQYLDILEDAAAFGLMVNLHGCTSPKGWERTWPNLLTMEAVRGAEQYFFASDYPTTAVWHNTILPFTRNVVGSMDYTPVTFSNQRYTHHTTAGHELALSVVFASRLQHFADSAESYRSLPPHAQAFLAVVPATWDETRLVDGYPGDFVVIARRSGADWYMGGISGSEARALRLPVGEIVNGATVELIIGPDLELVDVPVVDGIVTIELGAGDGFVLSTDG